MKVHTNPEVDSLFALKICISTSPLRLTVTRPGCVSWRLLNEFHAFSTRRQSDPEVQAACLRPVGRGVPGLPRLFSTLDGQQLLVVEGSRPVPIYFSDLWTNTSRPLSARLRNNNRLEQVFCVVFFLCRLSVGPAWSVPSAELAGAAKKWRERRLRQFLRHERLGVALALAESTHHAATETEGGQARGGG